MSKEYFIAGLVGYFGGRLFEFWFTKVWIDDWF